MTRTWLDTRYVYYGTSAERAAFPAAGEAAGALFFDYDDETWYYWDGAAWQTLGAGGWKLGNTLVVSSSGDGDYLTVAAAAAAAGAGDVILIDSGIYNISNVTIPLGVYVRGMGMTATELSITAGSTYGLRLNQQSVIQDLTIAADIGINTIDLIETVGGAWTYFSYIINCELRSGAGIVTNTATGVAHGASTLVSMIECVTDMNADAAAYSVYFGVDGTLNVQGGYFKETSPTMESIGGTSADAVNLFNEPFLTNGITIAPWYGSYINASGKFFSTDLFQDMDERAAAPANPDANRWRVWVESDGLHILNNAGSEYIFPGGIDPTGHTHSKIVASDGAPDPAWSVDAAGNLAAAGAYSLDVNAGEIILDADADTSLTADTDDQIDFKINSTDIFRMVATALKSQGSTFPDLGTTTLAEKLGSVYLGTAKDFYPRDDGAGLFQRGETWATWNDDFNSFAGYAWAGYAGFVTPSNLVTATYPSLLQIYHAAGDGVARAFAYKAVSTNAKALCALGSLNIRTGVRMDDGTNNNYIELWLDPAGNGLVRLWFRYAVGGAVTGPTQYWGGVSMPPMWYSLLIARSGTSYLLYASTAFNGPFMQFLQTHALGWTATQSGLYHEHTAAAYSADRCSLFDKANIT
jgi:hypothetical protein